MPTQWHRDIGGLGPAGLRRPEIIMMARAGPGPQPEGCSHCQWHLKARCLPVCCQCVRASALARAAGERAAWPHSSWPPRLSGLAREIISRYRIIRIAKLLARRAIMMDPWGTWPCAFSMATNKRASSDAVAMNYGSTPKLSVEALTLIKPGQ
jgi:hypothetical protein